MDWEQVETRWDTEKTELEKRVAGIEGMVANLIVDQQVMATSFNARGDRR